MKAIVYKKYGNPEVLTIKEIKKPIPKDNEILIKVHATSVTAADWRMRKADPFLVRLFNGVIRPKKIQVLGAELSGEVVQIGSKIKKFKVEDNVFASCDFKFGAYAEYICLPENDLIEIKPCNISFEEAATIPLGGLTALRFLRMGNIKKDQNILIYGASGSVGTFAIQLAKIMGANVTAVCSRDNISMVKSLGADTIIDYTNEDFANTNQQYDLVFNAVGKVSKKVFNKLVNKEGKYISVKDKPKSNPNDLLVLKKLVETNQLKTVIDRIYKFEEIREAHKYVEKFHKKGNVPISLKNLKANLLALLTILILTSCSKKINNYPIGQIEKTSESITNEQQGICIQKMHSFPNNTEIAIAIVNNNETKFMGVKKINGQINFVDNSQSVFEIGSITKVFTATLLAGFVIENKVQLNDEIKNYLPFSINTNSKITLKQLANHTSGLPRLPSNIGKINNNNPFVDYDDNKLKNYLSKEIPLNKSENREYNYSNLGVGILGYVLEQFSSKTYEELLQQKIVQKYQLVNTSTDRNKINSSLVPGLNKEGNSTTNWDFNSLEGAGAIVSSVSDLSKFAIAQFDNNNAELILTQRPTFKINQNHSIGLGWHIQERKDKGHWLIHSGGTVGYTASIILNKQNKSGVIILSNVSAFNKKSKEIEILGQTILETITHYP